MKRNSLAIDSRLLNRILSTDYEALRTDKIERCSKETGAFAQWLKDSAGRPASEHKDNALAKHFEFHSGHCSVCHEALEVFVYPLDRLVPNKYHKHKPKDIVHLPACSLHTEELKGYHYQDRRCPACACFFRTGSFANYCSLACRSFADYHNRKKPALLKYCKQCAEPFLSKRSDSIFCSAKCRVGSFRKAKARIY